LAKVSFTPWKKPKITHTINSSTYQCGAFLLRLLMFLPSIANILDFLTKFYWISSIRKDKVSALYQAVSIGVLASYITSCSDDRLVWCGYDYDAYLLQI
jgi:hypothetical protein